MGRPRKDIMSYLLDDDVRALCEQAALECATHKQTAPELIFDDMNRIFDERELAARLSLSPHVVRHWRKRGTGPNYFKLGDGRAAPVRYHWDDVLKLSLIHISEPTRPY